MKSTAPKPRKTRATEETYISDIGQQIVKADQTITNLLKKTQLLAIKTDVKIVTIYIYPPVPSDRKKHPRCVIYKSCENFDKDFEECKEEGDVCEFGGSSKLYKTLFPDGKPCKDSIFSKLSEDQCLHYNKKRKKESVEDFFQTDN